MSDRTPPTPERPVCLAAADPFEKAARLVAEAVETVTAARGRARLALSGGSAAACAPLVAEKLVARGFDFERLFLTWIDERCVPVSSRESNRGTTRFEPAPGVVLPLFLDDEVPAEAAARVERELSATFDGELDVVLLGMGPDGHVASLFPGRPPLPGLAAYVADSPKPPPDRITLTRAMLDTAEYVVLVVSGESKREALERLLASDPALPATGLSGLVVVTDLDPGGSS